MSLLLILNLFLSSPSNAALSIKPGLWSVQSKMKHGGKEFDPQAQMREALAKMPPEQRKQMESMMAKMGGNSKGQGMAGFSDKGYQVCYTSEMLSREESIQQNMDKTCETKFPVKTAGRLVAEFNCKNGTTGTAEWKIVDSTHYEGKVSMKGQGAENSTIEYKGEFVSADCGKLKPKK